MNLQSRLRRLCSSALNSMITNKHSLKALTEPILRPFRISPADGVEFPRRTLALLTWTISLIRHYASETEVSDAYRQRMETLTVKELRWYKESNTVEHEYVIVIVADPQYRLSRFLRLDRARDDPSEDTLAYQTADSMGRYASSDFSDPSFNSSIPSLHENVRSGCLDTIRVLIELPEFDRLLERSTFWSSQPGHRAPTLLDLALVAKAVHENNNYKPWSKQCVWFSSMICRVLQSDFQHQITHRDSSLTFQAWMMEVLEEEIGTFKARAIHKEQERMSKDVVAAFQSNRLQVLHKIEEAAKRVARNKEQVHIVDEAVAQREEAAAITAEASVWSLGATAREAEAAARAMEAEARAETESRLKEEAEKRARDEALKHALSQREIEELKRRIAELEGA